MTGAVTAHESGLDTLVIEKADCYGGTTALSGGVIWVPNNHRMSSAAINDSDEEAFTYLDAVVSEDVPRDKLRAYINQGPQMLEFLEKHSLVQYDPAPEYPDYYSEKAGGKLGARSLDPKPYTQRQLGSVLSAQMRMPDYDYHKNFSMTADEAHQVFSFTWRSHVVIFKRLFSFWLDVRSRLKRLPDNRLTLGRALVGRLRKSLEQKDILLWLNCPAQELVVENGRIVGVVAEKDGKSIRIGARAGVLLATGGFSNNDEWRSKYHKGESSSDWTAANEGDTGDGIRMASQMNAKLGMMDYAWWTPTMRLPDGKVEAFIVGKTMPGSMVVNKRGERFCNEAEPYEDFVKSQYADHEKTGCSIPAYFVFDGRYRKEYPLGIALGPGKFVPDTAAKDLFDSGWIRKADTLEALAEACGIDPKGLCETASKLEEFGKDGVDADFGKGSTPIDVYYSDHRIKPNPCLWGLVKPPFYAIELWPGDLGTKGGVMTDEYGRALDVAGQPIEGLYVTGNSSASVMGNSYPGAGATIGPAMTFSYVAALHASQAAPAASDSSVGDTTESGEEIANAS
ncbi:3-oxosteroid 1-dehydrogenase [BD1-7 clade bacterium]|uniref:3-oxosteroid 1-dehydrogenase n=1 Tax=BD1-7 clade bacterium TaxID=2029982 RepID=A0A5S9QTI8_9GAMM|nr:3-oxosteroid 1-dehydrogenase [BD1-7 clade bacterium]